MPLAPGSSRPPPKPLALGVESFCRSMIARYRLVCASRPLAPIQGSPGCWQSSCPSTDATHSAPTKIWLPPAWEGAIESVCSFHWLAHVSVLYWQLPITSAVS